MRKSSSGQDWTDYFSRKEKVKRLLKMVTGTDTGIHVGN
jgi:hypothetical protein